MNNAPNIKQNFEAVVAVGIGDDYALWFKPQAESMTLRDTGEAVYLSNIATANDSIGYKAEEKASHTIAYDVYA